MQLTVRSLLCSSKPHLYVYWSLPDHNKLNLQLFLSDVNAFHNLYKTDTSLKRTFWSVPRGVRLKRFYCILNFNNTQQTSVSYSKALLQLKYKNNRLIFLFCCKRKSIIYGIIKEFALCLLYISTSQVYCNIVLLLYFLIEDQLRNEKQRLFCTLSKVYPKTAERSIPCAPLHSLNYSTVIIAAAELLGRE